MSQYHPGHHPYKAIIIPILIPIKQLPSGKLT